MIRVVDPQLWNRKAVAFVVRCHRHLWGRHSDAPLAFVFEQGLKNAFLKELTVGWNKFPQHRSLQDWGLALQEGIPASDQPPPRILLPPGLVIPCIREKQLLAVTIYRYADTLQPRSHTVAGSRPAALILDKGAAGAALVPHILDALLLFQERGDDLSVVVPHSPETALDPETAALMTRASRVLFPVREEDLDHWSGLGGNLPSPTPYTDMKSLLREL